MIKNRNLDPDARERCVVKHLDLSADEGKQFSLFYALNRQAKIKAIDVIYSIATGTHTCYSVRVGYPAALTKWLTFVPSTSTTINTVQNKTITSATTYLPVNKPLLLTVGSTANSNVGEIDVAVTYEVIDRAVV